MKIAYFPNQAALNSRPVLDAFLQGCNKLGIETVANAMDADAAVIWSVLFQGRMRPNQAVYEHYRKQNKNVFVIEVGSLKRGELWKISLNNINRLAAWGNEKSLDFHRPAMLGLKLQQTGDLRAKTVLIAGQHERSLQWAGMPSMAQWFNNTVTQVRQHTDMPIIIRCHPRFPVPSFSVPGVSFETPIKLHDTYDDFNINYNHHCVISHNSGPGIQSAIYGTPVICHSSSLAYPVSTTLEQIENPVLPDREEWFLKLCHTEWRVDEIANGIPIGRLLDI